MAKELFLDKNREGKISITLSAQRKWEANKADIITDIERIVEDYDNQGYKLSLRQLYYQLVAGDIIPNHDKVYKKLSSILDDCRYSGLIDWYSIEDRGRGTKQAYYENSVEDALWRTMRSYGLDRQIGQPQHIEVWTEKDAISGIISGALSPYTIIMAVNKGYTSSSAIYNSYERFVRVINNGRKVTVLYFGDHDPSGLDMIRDITERIELFLHNGVQLDEYVVEDWLNNQNEDFDNARLAFIRAHFEVVPIGLTMAQIKQYNPPHNPAKITDPRAKKYVKQFGQKSWEVDALKPEIMVGIVKDAIMKIMDFDKYNEMIEEEQRDKTKLRKLIDIANGTPPPKKPRKPRKPAVKKPKAKPAKKASAKKKPAKKAPKKAAIKKPRKPKK